MSIGVRSVLCVAAVIAAPKMVPAAEVHVAPGTDIQVLINDRPEGTVYRLKPGVHRLQSIVPRSGDTFIGEDGTILNGARVISRWTREGTRWVSDEQTQSGSLVGRCNADSPRCNRPEDLYIDDVPLRHVASRTEVDGPGKWHFDYGSNKIYLHDDPRGRTVEIGLAPSAFSGSASNVTIRNLRIEKYANPAQRAAIEGGSGNRWAIENNVVTLNHGIGLRIGNNGVARGNKIVRNGQLGVSATGAAGLIEKNEIAFNNYAGFSPDWGAGAIRFEGTSGLTLRCNWVHDNMGHGLWAATKNKGVVFEKNRVVDNAETGIVFELGRNAEIRGNLVKGNGKARAEWPEGAQIRIADSIDVRVLDNTVQVDPNGGNGIAVTAWKRNHAHTARNITVKANTVTHAGTGGKNGAATDYLQSVFFDTERNIAFDGNTYHVGDRLRPHFEWRNGARTWSAFRSYGQERNGRIDTNVQVVAVPDGTPSCS